MKPKPLFILSLIVVFGVAGSCKDELPTQEDRLSIVLPNSNISYSRDVERLWSAWCLSCHSGQYKPNLTPPSYDSLKYYDQVVLFVAYDTNSVLIKILEGTTYQQMPPGSQRLTQNQINGVKKWITEGAQNN